MQGCIEQTELLSRRVYDGTYQLVKMKFTNNAQNIVDEAAQVAQIPPGNEQQYQEFQERMEQEAMERDRALEIKMFSTLVHLDAQKHNMLQLIDRMKNQAEQNLLKKEKEIQMLQQSQNKVGEGMKPEDGYIIDERQMFEEMSKSMQMQREVKQLNDPNDHQ